MISNFHLAKHKPVYDIREKNEHIFILDHKIMSDRRGKCRSLARSN